MLNLARKSVHATAKKPHTENFGYAPEYALAGPLHSIQAEPQPHNGLVQLSCYASGPKTSVDPGSLSRATFQCMEFMPFSCFYFHTCPI